MDLKQKKHTKTNDHTRQPKRPNLNQTIIVGEKFETDSVAMAS